MYRPLTDLELEAIAREHINYRTWGHWIDLMDLLCPTGTKVEVYIEGEYDDNGGTNYYIRTVNVVDGTGATVNPDMLAPIWDKWVPEDNWNRVSYLRSLRLVRQHLYPDRTWPDLLTAKDYEERSWYHPDDTVEAPHELDECYPREDDGSFRPDPYGSFFNWARENESTLWEVITEKLFLEDGLGGRDGYNGGDWDLIFTRDNAPSRSYPTVYVWEEKS